MKQNELNKVTLTFDDGPNPPYTDQILEILKREKIKAIFFVCGANIKKNPTTLKKITAGGHLIGNHAFSHNRLKTQTGFILNEILMTQKLINDQVHIEYKLFRPPYGIIPPWFKNKLLKLGFVTISYDTIGQDWKNLTAEKICKNILKTVHNGSTILLHDGHNINNNADRSKTVEALELLIPQIKKRNYQFSLPRI